MTTQPDYFRFLEAAQQAQTAEKLLAQGFAVEADFRSGEAVFDLVAIKGSEKLAYEFKAGRSQKTSRENLIRLQQAAKVQGFEFHIVVVNPPRKVHVEVENLTGILSDYLLENTPDALNTLSTQTIIEGVCDVGVEEIKVGEGVIKVAGFASIDVTLQYGSTSDGVPSSGDSFPCSFRLTLESDGSLLSVDKLEVDTSAFYE